MKSPVILGHFSLLKGFVTIWTLSCCIIQITWRPIYPQTSLGESRIYRVSVVKNNAYFFVLFTGKESLVEHFDPLASLLRVDLYVADEPWLLDWRIINIAGPTWGTFTS